MTPCFVYLRVSGLAQVDGMGFDRQLTACEDYAQRNDLSIIKVFREEGVSGKNELDNRPALREVLAELMADGVKTVLVEKLDRLARSLIVQETILQDFQRRNFHVFSANEAEVTSDDPTRILIRQVLGAFFEYERKMISSKLADARRRVKAKTGRCEGRKPYGTTPEEQRILQEMRGFKRMGYTTKGIALSLNNAGWPSRSGKPWQPGSVGKILARLTISCTPTTTHDEVSQ